MSTQVVTGKDGRLETIDARDPCTKEKLERTRRELRDMLSGNKQFHQDEFAQPAAEVAQNEEALW